MERTPITGIGKRSLSLPRISHLLRVILISLGMLAMIVGVVVALVFAITSLPHDNSVTLDGPSNVVINEPFVPVEIDAVIDEPIVMPNPTIEEAESVSLQEPVVASEVFVPTVSLLQIEWRATESSDTIPSRGVHELYTGTINNFVGGGISAASGGIPERVAIVQSAMPERSMHLDTIAIHRDATDEQLLITAINQATLGPTWMTVDPILFVSNDGGMTWITLSTPERIGDGPTIISEVRRRGTNFFIRHSGQEWMTN